MVELVDTQDLKSCDHCDRAGSIPAPGTFSKLSVDIPSNERPDKSRTRGFCHFIPFVMNLLHPLE